MKRGVAVMGTETTTKRVADQAMPIPTPSGLGWISW